MSRVAESQSQLIKLLNWVTRRPQLVSRKLANSRSTNFQTLGLCPITPVSLTPGYKTSFSYPRFAQTKKALCYIWEVSQTWDIFIFTLKFLGMIKRSKTDPCCPASQTKGKSPLLYRSVLTFNSKRSHLVN